MFVRCYCTHPLAVALVSLLSVQSFALAQQTVELSASANAGSQSAASANPASQSAASQSAQGQSDLRWTPHRGATANRSDTLSAPVAAAVEQPAEPLPAATAVAPLQPAASNPVPPASASLPSVERRAISPPDYAPLRSSFGNSLGDWISINRIAGSFSPSADPSDQTLMDTSLLRAPQGNHGRPILGVEGTPRRSTSSLGMQSAARPVSGGSAPRFNPNASRQATAARSGSQSTAPRGERLAMNVDGIPSVMTRGPQAAAVDDPNAPGRLTAPAAPAASGTLPAPANRSAPQSVVETIDPAMGMPLEMPGDMSGDLPEGFDPQLMQSGEVPADNGGMWMGQYPAQLHIESFYDDPYACEDEFGCLPCWPHEGRICAYLRSFGRPYYGWKWYRDFTASGGITSFQNETNLGLHGNYGTNEYANWAMPFWNAFGIGWQLGVRGVQSNFQSTTLTIPGFAPLHTNSRNQTFVTTGFFTRAFEGRGLQGGAVYDYLRDEWYDGADMSQVRGELSYVWGYHELGFWGCGNVADTNSIFSSSSSTTGSGSTLDLYTAFYRLHFGDANEWKVWGGATGGGNGIVGSAIRAPMSRSLAMEGTFTYVIPTDTQTLTIAPGTTLSYTPSAWNLSLNLVYYPAGRSRRSLASPYRPLFDVADNGSMIRSIAPFATP